MSESISLSEAILRNYIEILKLRSYKQNTDKWLEQRQETVGCSELYDASNTTKSQQKIIKNKCGMSIDISHVMPIIWGNIFEDSVKSFSEIYFKCKIYECPGNIRGSNGITSCSPDGLGIINIPIKNYINATKRRTHAKYASGKKQNRYNKLTNRAFPNHNTKYDFPIRCLFEFKSPISRDLKSVIKPEYMFQVLGGMNIIENVDMAAFIECKFVTCELANLNFDDECINPKDGYSCYNYAHEVPVFIGLKLVFMTSGAYENSFTLSGSEKVVAFCDESDFSAFKGLALGKDYFCYDTVFAHRIFDKFDARICDSVSMFLPEFKQEIIAEFAMAATNANCGNDLRFNVAYKKIVEIIKYKDQLYNNMMLVGYIPYKLFDYNAFYVHKLHDFIDVRLDKYKFIVDEVAKCKNQ